MLLTKTAKMILLTLLQGIQLDNIDTLLAAQYCSKRLFLSRPSSPVFKGQEPQLLKLQGSFRGGG